MTNWRTILIRQLPGGRRRMAALAAMSTGSGLLEAVVLVLAVQVAVAISQGAEQVEVSLAGNTDLSMPINRVVLLALAAAVAVTVLHLLTSHTSAMLSTEVLTTTRARALRAYGRASWDRQARENEGALQETVSSLATNSAQLVLAVTHTISALLSLVALIIAALVVQPQTTALVVAIGALLFALLSPLTRLTRRTSGRFVRANSRFTESVSEMSSLAFELRTFGVEEQRIQALVDQSGEIAVLNARARVATRVGQHLYRDVALIVLVGALAGLSAVDAIDFAAVGAVVLLMIRSLASAQDVNGSLHTIQNLRPNIEAVDERLQALEADANPPGDQVIDRIGTIELKGVSYRYGDEGRLVLDSVDLTIPHGEMLGIVGPSGGGKSTLVQILLRLRFPVDGHVLIDGCDLRDIAAPAWQALAAVVPQEPRLLAGTVADNISFHRPMDRSQITDAAKLAHIHAEIMDLPDGYDTVLGPRGIGLSGGQRQRLAIARALVGRPHLLILDEPTSALDVHSEAALQETIGDLAGEVTMVIIAHRLSTIAACKRLLILENGRVVGLGSHDDVRDHPFLRDRLG